MQEKQIKACINGAAVSVANCIRRGSRRWTLFYSEWSRSGAEPVTKRCMLEMHTCTSSVLLLKVEFMDWADSKGVQGFGTHHVSEGLYQRSRPRVRNLQGVLGVYGLCHLLPLQDEKQPHTSNIHAMVYSPSLHCIITGGEDCNIQVNYLSQESNGMQVNNFSGECCVPPGRNNCSRLWVVALPVAARSMTSGAAGQSLCILHKRSSPWSGCTCVLSAPAQCLTLSNT